MSEKSDVLERMTLRDYFAAKAMQGMLAHRDFDYCPMNESSMDKISKDAYMLADYMMQKRD